MSLPIIIMPSTSSCGVSFKAYTPHNTIGDNLPKAAMSEKHVTFKSGWHTLAQMCNSLAKEVRISIQLNYCLKYFLKTQR